MTKIHLLLIGLLFSPILSAQTFDGVTYVPPSPDAASLLEYASVPVNLYNGLPVVDIPLGTLKAKTASLPVSLSYHASGIKVQDVSGTVGLGWTLNAGGVITRVVRSLPDEHPQGYLNINFSTVSNDYTALTNGSKDGEPDIFYYNFMGHTGKIILDADGVPMQLPELNYKIVAPDFAATDPKWEITDLSGIRYVFGKTSSSRETTTVKMAHEAANKTRTYISAWYLADVIYPVGGEYITLNYSSGSNIYYENFRQVEGRQQPGQSLSAPCSFAQINPPFAVFNQTTQITVNSPKNISSIHLYRMINSVQTNLGSAFFNYTSGRQDITNARRLTSITLNNMESNQIKRFELYNDYYFTTPGCSDAICKRLKLDRVMETTNGFSVLLDQFQYYEDEILPARNSVKSDHWGYYNNNTYHAAVATVTDAFGNVYAGANKDPDLNKTKANSLIRITNGAGGHQYFNYTLNEYLEAGTTKSTGGLRVASIEEADGQGSVLIKNYTYLKVNTTQSSGTIYRNSRYHYEYKVYDACQSGFTSHQYGNSIVIRYSSSLVDQFDVGGLHVGYSDVQITYSNGAKELLYFHDFQSRPDDAATLYSPPGATHADFTSPDGPPFISRGDRSYERGLLREHIFLGADGLKKKRVVNEYDFYVASSKEIPGGRNLLMWSVRDCANCALYIYNKKGIYKYFHRGVRLLSTTEETYDQTDQNKKVSSYVSYGYNSKYSNLVANRYKTLNDGSVLKELTRYPFDYYEGAPYTSSDPNVDGLYLLCTKNMANYPVERIFSRKGPGETDGNYKATGTDLITYKRNPLTGNPVQAARFRLPVTDPIWIYVAGFIYNGGFVYNLGFLKRGEYLTYDAYDNPTEEITDTGESVAYEWGAQYKYTELTAMTRQAGGQQHRSTYTHKPMVGLLSSTDQNGRVTTYEYDLLNRLKTVKDNGDIVKRYKYHLKTQDEVFTASLTFGNSKVAGTNLAISVTNNATDDGQTTYNWNFGDGSSATTSYYSTSHVYSSPGTYQVSVTKSHPDYGSASASAPVTIIPPPAISICADGPLGGDRCTYQDFYYGECTSNPAPYSPTIISVSVSSTGCSSLTYYWEHNYNGGGTFSHGSASAYIPYFVGYYGVRCVAYDNCGNYAYSDWIYISFYKSDPNCPDF
jgi:YD repeat-containing protein